MCFKMKIIFSYGIIFTIIHSTNSQSRSKDCKRLEEKLNLTDVQKHRYHLEKCGGIHDTEASENISGGRDSVKRYRITRVSLLLPSKAIIQTSSCFAT